MKRTEAHHLRGDRRSWSAAPRAAVAVSDLAPRYPVIQVIESSSIIGAGHKRHRDRHGRIGPNPRPGPAHVGARGAE
jgi:hypothetical protein